MKKSEIREMIREELLKEGYIKDQILQYLKTNEDSNPIFCQMKMRGEHGETK